MNENSNNNNNNDKNKNKNLIKGIILQKMNKFRKFYCNPN